MRSYRNSLARVLLTLSLLVPGFLVIGAIPPPPPVSAAVGLEQRCADLGVNCVCSEPMNAAMTEAQRISAWYNPADSTTKQCSAEGASQTQFIGTAIIAPYFNVWGANDPAVLGLLPSGHSLQYYMRAPDGYTGSFDIGHLQHRFPTRTNAASSLPGGSGTVTTGVLSEYISTKRAALRFYFYTSPDWELTNIPGPCTNAKRARFDALTLSLQAGSAANGAYPFQPWPTEGWKPTAYNCCAQGPYNTGENPGPTVTAYRGKWWRYEAVATNRLGCLAGYSPGCGAGGNGYRLEVFIKNVTDNTPEIRVVDTNGTNAGGSPWTPSTDLTPTEYQTENDFPLVFNISGYRAGTCAGWMGFSHFMIGQWNTVIDPSTGQPWRIGRAYEIETGAPPPPPDVTPPGSPGWRP